MIKHTTLNLDSELLEEAKRVLGTSRTTDTIHRALREVINYHKRLRLLEYDFSDLTPETLDEMRSPRVFSDVGPS
jgi:Arc/MetJ family transcription regulator